jgi:hypothetical protein
MRLDCENEEGRAVNCARGPGEWADLAKALKEKQVAAPRRCFVEEPPKNSLPLALENVL